MQVVALGVAVPGLPEAEFHTSVCGLNGGEVRRAFYLNKYLYNGIKDVWPMLVSLPDKMLDYARKLALEVNQTASDSITAATSLGKQPFEFGFETYENAPATYVNAPPMLTALGYACFLYKAQRTDGTAGAGCWA